MNYASQTDLMGAGDWNVIALAMLIWFAPTLFFMVCFTLAGEANRRRVKREYRAKARRRSIARRGKVNG